MRHFYIFILFLFAASALFAQPYQDLIVSTGNDSIKCSIVQITTSGISFSSEQIPKGFLKNEQIASYKYGFYTPKSSNRYRVEGMESDTIFFHPTSRFILLPAWTYMPGNISYSRGSELSDYYNKLRNGWGINCNYELYNHWGQGIFASAGYSHLSNRLEKILFPLNDSVSLSGPLSDRINTYHFSLGYSGIDALDSLNTIRGYLGIGIMHWDNKGELIIPFRMKSWLPIIHAGFGYNRKIGKSCSALIDVSFCGGMIRNYMLNDEKGKRRIKLDKSNDINASKINFSLGLIWEIQ